MNALYIIHGWTYDIKPLETVVAELEKLNVNAELLRVPGLTEPSERAWTIKNYVGWANHNIPDGAIALGHSNGGRILMNLLTAKPNKLKGLILLDSAGIYHQRTAKHKAALLAAKTFAPLKRIKPLRKVFHKLIGASDYHKAPENMKKTLDNMIQSDKHLDPSTIITPTQIIWGDVDTITPLSDGNQLHALIKNSQLIVKQGWTHSHYLKNPKQLAQTIAQSFRELQK